MFSAAFSVARASSGIRISYVSLRSSTVGLNTTTPRWGELTSSPSRSSAANASRTGVVLTWKR